MAGLQPIPTGSLRLDLALRGGIPRGEFVEISGPPDSGKTTLCLHIVSAAQSQGNVCAWIDSDHTFDPSYALRCHVDPQRLYVSDPVSAEQAYEATEAMLKSTVLGVLVIDPVSALVTQAELDTPLGQRVPGDCDSLFSIFLRRTSHIVHQSGATVIFTTYPARGISATYHALSANPSRLALQLQAGLRLRLQRGAEIRKSGESLGRRIRVRVIKSQIPPCFASAEFDIIHYRGIMKAGDAFDLGVQLQLIHRLKEVYIFRGQKLGRQRQEAIQFLDQEEQKTLVAEIEQAIRQEMLPNLSPAAT
jgi:recombination protein RecA